MQVGDGPDGYAAGRFFFGRGETGLIGGDRVVDPAGGIIFQPDAQLPCHERDADIGVREAGGQRSGSHGWRLGCGEGESTMKILGKQSLPAVPGPRLPGANSAFRPFPGRMREISGNTCDDGSKGCEIQRYALAANQQITGRLKPQASELADIVTGLKQNAAVLPDSAGQPSRLGAPAGAGVEAQAA